MPKVNPDGLTYEQWRAKVGYSAETPCYERFVRAWKAGIEPEAFANEMEQEWITRELGA